MLLYPQPVPLNGNSIESWLNKMALTQRAMRIAGSPDTSITQGTQGVQLEVNANSTNPVAIHYPVVSSIFYSPRLGESFADYYTRMWTVKTDLGLFESHAGFANDRHTYNQFASYMPGDIVHVAIKMFAGYEYDGNTNAYDVEKPVWVLPGTYICVCPVPAYLISTQYNALLNYYKSLDYSTSIIASMLRVFPETYYAPVWPQRSINGQMAMTLLNKVDDGATKYLRLTRNLRYWDLISLTPSETLVCEGVNKRRYLVQGVSLEGSPKQYVEKPSEYEGKRLKHIIGAPAVDLAYDEAEVSYTDEEIAQYINNM